LPPQEKVRFVFKLWQLLSIGLGEPRKAIRIYRFGGNDDG